MRHVVRGLMELVDSCRCRTVYTLCGCLSNGLWLSIWKSCTGHSVIVNALHALEQGHLQDMPRSSMTFVNAFHVCYTRIQIRIS